MTAGDELIVAQNHFYTGLGYNLAGIAVGVIFHIKYKDDGKLKINGTVIIGGGSILIGTIYWIELWSHIGKAGKLLNCNFQGSNLNLDIIGCQIKLTYKFNRNLQKVSPIVSPEN